MESIHILAEIELAFFCDLYYDYRRPVVGDGGGFRTATLSLLTLESLAGKVKAFEEASLALLFLGFPLG